MELENKRIAILLADDYEDLEFWYLYYRMKEFGANVKAVGCIMSADKVKGRKGYMADIDMRTDTATADMFDAIIIPGGWSADRLSWCESTIELIKNAFAQGKLIASISQGVWVLASADILKEKNVTSDPKIRENIKNLGAGWTDTDIVVDGNIITSRSTSDLPVFSSEIIKALIGNDEPK